MTCELSPASTAVGGQRRADRGVDLGIRTRVLRRLVAARRPQGRRTFCAEQAGGRAALPTARQASPRHRRAARGRPGSSCPAEPGRCRNGSPSGRESGPPTGPNRRARLPTTSSASLSAAAFCSARSRTDAPTDSGCASSSTPLPLTVVATGAPSASARAVSSALRVDRAASGDDHRSRPRPPTPRPPVAQHGISFGRWRLSPRSAVHRPNSARARRWGSRCARAAAGAPVKLPNASVTAAAASSALRTRRLQRTS